MSKISFSTKVIIFFIALIFSCQKNEEYKSTINNPELYRGAIKQISNVIVHDIFSPPVASRIYAYSSIAAYEVLALFKPENYQTLANQLNALEPLNVKKGEQADLNLSSVHALLVVGKALTFSEDKMQAYIDNLYKDLDKKGLPSDVKEQSIELGSQVAQHILQWASKDNYAQTRTFPKYTIRSEEQYWKPTPPDYMEGIEPHWKEIRTMVLDSAGQFKPIEPLPFSLDKNSPFYKQLLEVYDVGRKLDTNQTNIASFWDCNPYVSHHKGHAMFATKKITPGGHWIGITIIATRQKNSDFPETIESFTRVSIALFDAFISCWDEKWNSILVRPETLINKYLDEEWLPLLQTPPFPEYTSGHSVISKAAAITLTDMLGDNFAFNDTTEMEYGLEPRQFKSFLQASDEAAISRLYGGIHYRMAIENGVAQGEQVGNFVIKNLITKKN